MSCATENLTMSELVAARCALVDYVAAIQYELRHGLNVMPHDVMSKRYDAALGALSKLEHMKYHRENPHC